MLLLDCSLLFWGIPSMYIPAFNGPGLDIVEDVPKAQPLGYLWPVHTKSVLESLFLVCDDNTWHHLKLLIEIEEALDC